MRWPNIDVITSALGLPADICVRQLARADISAVLALLDRSHPQLAVGDAAELLTESFYDNEVALAGEAQAIADRPSYVLLLASSAGVIACLVLEYEVSEQALFGRLAVVDPDARGRGLGRSLLDAEELLGRALGANVTYGFVALDNRAQCAALVRTGRLLCGILPNSDRRLIDPTPRDPASPIDPSQVRYVPRAIYAKLLVPTEALQWPAPEVLRPTTAAMMKLLFDRPSPAVPLGHVGQVGQVGAPVLDGRVAAKVADRPAGTWPDIALITQALTLPAGVTLRQLARSDIPDLIARLPAWYPEIEGGIQQRLLTTSFYDELVALAQEDQSIARRPIHGRVFMYKGEMIGFNYSICELKRSTLRAEFIVIDPRHRGLGLVLALLPFKVLLGRAIGIETVVAMSTLQNPYRQMAAERSGFRLVGILPAAGVQAEDGAGAKYVFEALYALSLVPPEQSYIPPPAEMAPGLAAVAEFVLGGPGANKLSIN